ncbi:MAG: hypothetical protein IT456_01005 [Planctomycetes bacterium]|nr:hypothetical protein [Planctomycetota bacterium]
MNERAVFVILADFEGDLWSLSRTQHVWLLSSPHNDAQARTVWDREQEDYSAERGVTTFVTGGEKVSELYGILGTVDCHHGEDAVVVPWTTIHVRGVVLADVSTAAVAEEVGDGIEIAPEPEGFVIKRTAPHVVEGRDRSQGRRH